jgi:hypothetical protein
LLLLLLLLLLVLLLPPPPLLLAAFRVPEFKPSLGLFLKENDLRQNKTDFKFQSYFWHIRRK